METSVFFDKSQTPDDQMLTEVLEKTYPIWTSLRAYVHEQYPSAIDEWNFPGAKYGWSFRIKDKKRAIIYLLPREKFFMAAFVFGQKATDIILSSKMDAEIRNELASARVYAEGRGIRIPIHDSSIIPDIQELIRIKLST
jgi:hypothetical protein